MRERRQKESPLESDAYYHLITRTVAGEFLFGDVEKEVLRKHLWLVAERCGIKVITYAVMANHVHVVVYAPKQMPLSDQELLRRYALLHCWPSEWEERKICGIREMLAANGEEAVRWRAWQLRYMGDISTYMKLLKQRFSIWYNRTHNRFGTLWAERFRSLQLEPGQLVERIAAYVDVNAVRAALCEDPKDYRFCGYAEAVAGNVQAQNGIVRAMGATSWDEAQSKYRTMIVLRAARPTQKGSAVSEAIVDEVIARNGKLTMAEQLRCRCEYFTRGAVLGSRAFIMEKLTCFRRKTGRGKRMEPSPAWGAATGFAVMHKIRVASPVQVGFN